MSAGGSPLITMEDARAAAREEIASMCGLVLRRMQDLPAASQNTTLAAIFGELLRDFGGTRNEPGDDE